MRRYQIEIRPTNNKSIVKFETDRFLTEHQNFEFGNIEEAKDSPVAQKLFHLPFVKTVYIAQNFIAIEKYDIVEWEDVKKDVAEQISTYLNQGLSVINTEEKDKKIPITVYAESTPNPGAMKFVTNKKLTLKTLEFKNIEEAKNAPIVQALFHFPFVKEVFLDDNFISVTKYNITEWEEIAMELREFIRNYLEEGKEILSDNFYEGEKTLKSSESQTSTQNLDSTSKEIVAILEEYVKPAVASDGGNIMFESYNPESKQVKVVLQGACSGCPSSTITLKNGIESMLREMLKDKVESVEAING